jgi:hypothetical protein
MREPIKHAVASLRKDKEKYFAQLRQAQDRYEASARLLAVAASPYQIGDRLRYYRPDIGDEAAGIVVDIIAPAVGKGDFCLTVRRRLRNGAFYPYVEFVHKEDIICEK